MSDVTIWTREQIRQVQGVRQIAFADRLELDRHRDDLLDTLHRKMARALIEACHTFAVEVRPDDVQMREGEEGSTDFAVEYVARWRPTTRTVEFRGGPVDGMLREVQGIGDPVNVAVHQPVWADLPDEPAVMTRNYVTYSLDGWDEDAGRWVYRP